MITYRIIFDWINIRISQLLIEFFPFSCLKCGEQVSNKGLCHSCWSNIRWITKPNCTVCYRELGFFNLESSICPKCEDRKTFLDSICSPMIYNNHSKDLILKFKNFNRIEIAEWILSPIKNHLPNVPFDYIVPVPLHNLKLIWRGYNQAAQLAKIISSAEKIPYSDLLRKTRFTKSQGLFNKNKRIDNVKNSFSVKSKFNLVNKTVLLVDDVYTTGSTMEECARILKKSGVSQVFGISMAKT